MNSLLLVDDNPRDLQIAADTARDLGITDLNAQSSVLRARQYLENALKGELPLPEGIVLDLDLGFESGFELLRYWHSTPQLTQIPMIIWSVVDRQREICDLFRVQSFVSKWEGPEALHDALSQLASKPASLY